MKRMRRNPTPNPSSGERERELVSRHFDLVGRGAHDVVLLVDAEGRIVEANDRAEEMYGWPRSELIGMDVRELRDPGSAPDLADRLEAVRLRDGMRFEARHRRRGGFVFPVEVSARVVQVGTESYCQTVIRDISERRQMEKALEGTVTYQIQLLATLQEAVIGLDSHRRIRSWAGAAERIYGWSAAAVLGRPVREVLCSEQSEADEEAMFARLGSEGTVQIELHQRRRDGTRISIEQSATTLRGPDGLPSGYVLASRDVTGQRKAEEAARLSEQKFRTGIMRAGFGMLLVGPEGRILETNRAVQTVLGYSEEELRRLTIIDINHPEDRARCERQFEGLRAGDYDTHQEERRYVRKDGAVVDVMLRATAVRDELGQFQFSIGIVEDLTEKKKLEAQLMASERMASIGTLAAGVAHEINNPLAFVLANLAYALEELDRQGGTPPEAKRALQDAREGASRVRDIVRDLKVFSHEAGAETGNGADLAKVVESAAHLAQNEIRHRAHLVLAVGELPRVRGSDGRLGQVVLNLLVNAAQAIPDGHADRNEIRVTAAVEDADWVVLEVSDTGVGIRPEIKEKIFDPFFTTKPMGVGTGLGLSICHGIVGSLGGTITVDSRPWEGSTFRVRLPVEARAQGATLAEPAHALAERSLRILVVDDEPMVGNAIRRVLGSKHQVEVVGGGRAALSRLEGTPEFDLVLCDVMMPEMSGLELHARLSERSPALASRVVFMTGGAFASRARERLDELTNPCIEKPFDPKTLCSLVESFARGGAGV